MGDYSIFKNPLNVFVNTYNHLINSAVNNRLIAEYLF